MRAIEKMYGFCGFTNHMGINSEEAIKIMIDKLTCRGPHFGYYVDEFVSLGCNASNEREGHPVFNETQTIVAVGDVRIYNLKEIKDKLKDKHKFRSNTDIEVVIHAYEEKGIRCLDTINGEWNLCIWDCGKKTIFLCVDHFAIKRLYCLHEGENLVFASELKSILVHPAFRKQIDPLALRFYLTFGCIPESMSIFRKTRRVPQGRYVEFDMRSKMFHIQPYCNLTSKKPSKPNGSVASLTHALFSELQKSVARRVPNKEPIGLFLSGGVDSSSLLYILRQLRPYGLHIFTIGFKPQGVGVPNESAKARAFAEKMEGVVFHELICSVEDLISGLLEISRYLDEPVSDIGVIGNYMLSQFAKRHVNIVFKGDGADELFGGYETYVMDIILHRYEGLLRKAEWLAKPLTKSLFNLTDSFQSNVNPLFMLREVMKSVPFEEHIRHFMFRSIFLPAELNTLLRPEYRGDESGDVKPITDQLKTVDLEDFAEGIIRLDMLVSLQNYMITTTAFASTAAQLEVREPFLDRELAEFALSIPVSLKIRGTNPFDLIQEIFFKAHVYQRKYIFKKTMENKLPDEILRRSKVGFGVPVKPVIEKMKPVIYELLGDEILRRQGIFEIAAVKDLLETHFKRHVDERKKIWALLMFQLWYYNFYEHNDELIQNIRRLMDHNFASNADQHA